MAPDAARLAAARVVHDVVYSGAFVGPASQQHLSLEGLDARDRAFASALLYGTLARWKTLIFYLEKGAQRASDELDRRVTVALALSVFQLYFSGSVPAYAAVNAGVELVRYFVGERAVSFANAVLRRLSRRRPEIPAGLEALHYGLSNELFGVLKKSYGPQVAREIGQASLDFDPTTEIRLNTLKPVIGDAELGVPVEAGYFLATARRLLLGGQSIQGLSAFQEGRIAVQGEASQWAVELAGVQPGERVLDLCAGAGGKSHALAAAMQNQGEIVAVDNHEERSRVAGQEAARLGVTLVSRLVRDAAAPGLIAAVGDGYDLVFLDAPCSGLGLLGKKPEIRLRMNYARIQELVALQQALLQNAAQAVRPGGRLLYATCTNNRLENEEQIASFLASTAGRVFDRLPFPEAPSGERTLFAYRDRVDGYFVARLVRARS